MDLLVAIFCTLVLAAGWYYATNTSAVDKLVGVERDRPNLLRKRLRRLNGIQLIVLAAAFYWGYVELDRRSSPTRFVLAWMLVMVLLFFTIVLALVDMWLTAKLRSAKPK